MSTLVTPVFNYKTSQLVEHLCLLAGHPYERLTVVYLRAHTVTEQHPRMFVKLEAVWRCASEPVHFSSALCASPKVLRSSSSLSSTLIGEQLREVMNVVEHMHQREDAYRRKIKVSGLLMLVLAKVLLHVCMQSL